MYIIPKTLLTMRQVELIEKKKCTIIDLDLKDEAFVVYIAASSPDLDIHPFCKAI